MTSFVIEHPVVAGWLLLAGAWFVGVCVLSCAYLIGGVLWDWGHWIRQRSLARKDLRQTPPTQPAPRRRPDLIGVTDPHLPGVVHVIPYDFAAARRAKDRLKAEEAFYETGWGEEGRRH